MNATENQPPDLSRLLGYLNFSNGKPDARFQANLNEAHKRACTKKTEQPRLALRDELMQTLTRLEADSTSPFRDGNQARAVINLVFDELLPAYRSHHRDLLSRVPDEDLYSPWFLVRAFETVLARGGPWEDSTRIVDGALVQLNDYVGHRPVAILESRPKGEPYAHERVRPIPLYIRGAGVAHGRYHDLISRTLEVLESIPSDILSEAQFDPAALDELAADPRPYDQGHPAHRRPNYVFGEWDPDHIDRHGHYRRFVLRHVVLDGLLQFAATSSQQQSSPDAVRDDGEALFEASVVMAATILMAAGVRGSGPGSHDSATTLATLMPRIARYRDAFYTTTLDSLRNPHGERLREQARIAKQPFALARQHLNDYLATERAKQLQHRHLALLFSAMGYPTVSTTETAKIAVPSIRMLGEIHSRIATSFMAIERGDLEQASTLLPEIENVIHRGIDCGALVDPWNILGFQALFPLSPAREDSVRDTRVDDLVFAVEQYFLLYSRLMSEAAATGKQALAKELRPAMRRFAVWWDQFATVEVSDVRHVHGAEAVLSAKHVASTLGRWHAQGEASGDLAFWKRHLEGFRSPKAFTAVIAALLEKKDYRAAMALLVNWIGHVDQIPLEDGEFSFYPLAMRWLLGAAQNNDHVALITKFFDYLEANAGEYWEVPTLETERLPMPKEKEADDDVFGAAYEDMTYQDSTDDGTEGSVVGDGEPRKEFLLEAEAEHVGRRLRFLSSLAQLWQLAVRIQAAVHADSAHERGHETPLEDVFDSWLDTARNNQKRLLALLDTLNDHPIPEPTGSHESMVDYDRHRILKEQLLYAAIGTCLDTTLAVIALRSARDGSEAREQKGQNAIGWGPLAVDLESAIWHGDAEEVCRLLPTFFETFGSEPLLFTALADGGSPRSILRARLAQSIVRALVVTLPRLALLRETFHILRQARGMEQANRPDGRSVSEFNTMFQMAMGAVGEAVTDAARDTDDAGLTALLEQITGRFVRLWAEYSQSLHMSALDVFRTEQDWHDLQEFIRTYGRDLFHARFLTLANLRGVLHRGVGNYLDYLIENADPLHPVRLTEELDRKIPREKAERLFEIVLQGLIENYEEYKDYNSTAAQSDYGDNLYILFDFLRLKAMYERQAWLFRPLNLAHEVLARKGRDDAAVIWEEHFARLSAPVAERFVHELELLERRHGVRIRTIRDRFEERFVKPLAVDRLCALVGPAMEEARRDGAKPSFDMLHARLLTETAKPTGAGTDVPAWIRRLESEVQRVQSMRSAVSVLAEQQLRVPQRVITVNEVERQLREWD